VKRSEKTFISFRFGAKQGEKKFISFRIEAKRKNQKRNEHFSKVNQSENTLYKIRSGRKRKIRREKN
jgi:hypothetical protein